MGNWKHALLPLLTALTVLVLALVPPRLSRLEDEGLIGVIHPEALAEDSNFPAKPPDMAGRVWLLTQWQLSPGGVTIVEQVLSEPAALSESEVLARAALAELTESGILPSGQPAFEEGFWFYRLYLRNTADLSSAGFLVVESREKSDYALHMILDLETGLALTFRLVGQDVYLGEISSRELGRRFLARLGLEYEPLDIGGLYSFGFRLTEQPCVFGAYAARYLLKFGPEADRDAVPPESGGAAVFGK